VILVVLIVVVFGSILAFVIASVTRRVRNTRRYEKLDRLREEFRKEIPGDSTPASIDRFVVRTRVRPGTIEWAALEDVLFSLVERENQAVLARRLFGALGYTRYYQDRLTKGSSIDISTAADRLGRIGDSSSIDLLAKLLFHKETEVATVALRALCRIGKSDALHRVLDALPAVMKEGRVSQKAIQTSLMLFEPWAAETMLRFAKENEDPKILALIIETLIGFPPRQEAFDYATACLSHPDPEVRGKALRLLAQEENTSFTCDWNIFVPLLTDPVWFVRLQAAKTLGKMHCENFIDMLKQLSLDERWQVRDAAAFALAEIGEPAVDAFLELMQTPDRYAKESICEEIQRSGFVLDLIEYLGEARGGLNAKAKQILAQMHGLGFSAPLRDAFEMEEVAPGIRTELAEILQTGGAR
jgi:HEAT repeat protein